MEISTLLVVAEVFETSVAFELRSGMMEVKTPLSSFCTGGLVCVVAIGDFGATGLAVCEPGAGVAAPS